MTDKPQLDRVRDEGVQPEHRLIANDPVTSLDQWSQHATLAALSEDYVFFTHGLFFTRGGMAQVLQDPVQDFVNHCPKNIEPLILSLDYAIFTGMGTRPEHAIWDRRLIGIENAAWPQLMGALSGVASVDRRRSRYWQSTRQKLEILDPLVMMRATHLPDPLPRVTIWAFGVDSNTGIWVFPETRDIKTVPTPHRLPPRAEIVTMAKALLTQDTAQVVQQEIERGN